MLHDEPTGPSEDTAQYSTIIMIPSEPADSTMAPPVRFLRRESRKKSRQTKQFVIPRAPEACEEEEPRLQFEMDDADMDALIKGWKEYPAHTTPSLTHWSV